MAPAAVLIPLIAAGLTAGGGVAAAAISSKAAKSKSAMPGSSSALLPEDTKNKQGIIPLSANPLGDTTNPYLQRGKLLGN